MNYTCKDCKVQCMERSREYPCASFKLMTASESGVKRVKGMSSKNTSRKSEFDQSVAESEKGIGVKFEGLSDEKKKISVAFARKIKTLSPEAQKAIQDLLF